MRGDLFPYSEYKNSGLPCFGQIPTHWNIFRNGQIFTQRNQTGFPNLPILEVSLKSGVRVKDFEKSKRNQIMNDREKYKRAIKGDIAYNMMRMWQGAVGVAPVDGLVSPAYVVANPFPEVDSRYYSYLFRTQTYMNEVNKYSHGIVADRNRLYWDEFKQMPSIFPPSNEQKKIADFLDDHGRKLSRLIRIKKRQLELLREQKQAIVNNAVTRGINADVQLMSSGVDWLGDIPVHWKVKKTKHIFRPVSIKNHPNEDFLSVTQNRGVIPKSMLEERIVEAFVNFESFKLVQPGNFVISLRSFQGGLEYSEYQGIVSPAYTVLKSIKSINDRYYKYLFKCFDFIQELQKYTSGIRQGKNIDYNDLKDVYLPDIPLEEQAEIIEYISYYINHFDTLISKTEQEIELITQYRNRLISDAVTGKIDLRETHIDIISQFDSDSIENDDDDDELDNEEVLELEECEV